MICDGTKGGSSREQKKDETWELEFVLFLERRRRRVGGTWSKNHILCFDITENLVLFWEFLNKTCDYIIIWIYVSVIYTNFYNELYVHLLCEFL